MPLRLLGGALGGGLGALAVSAPLDFCTFSDEYQTKDLVFGLVLMALGAAAGTAAARAVFAPGKPSPNEISHAVWRSWWMPWLLLSPTLAVLIVFLYWPALRTIQYSTKLARLSNPKRIDRCTLSCNKRGGSSP